MLFIFLLLFYIFICINLFCNLIQKSVFFLFGMRKKKKQTKQKWKFN